jgi:hypothetical protein
MGEGGAIDLDAFVEQVIDEVRRPLVGRGPSTQRHYKRKSRRKNKAARASRRRNRK